LKQGKIEILKTMHRQTAGKLCIFAAVQKSYEWSGAQGVAIAGIATHNF